MHNNIGDEYLKSSTDKIKKINMAMEELAE